MATPEETRLVLQIEANIKSLENALKRAGLLTKQTTETIETGFGNAGRTVQQQMNSIGSSVEKGTKQAQQGVRNLTFQLNDITQGLMSGTSPFTIMVQQASQVQQAVGDLGKGGVFKGLGLAIGSMLSPASLAISGLILGFGYLTQAAVGYFKDTKDEAEASEEVWKQHKEAVSAMKDAYGDAMEGLDAYKKKTGEVAAYELQRSKDRLTTLTADLQKTTLSLGGEVIDFNDEEAVRKIKELRTAMREAQEAGDQVQLERLQAEFRSLANPANAASAGLVRVQDAFKGLEPEIQAFAQSAKDGTADFIALDQALALKGLQTTDEKLRSAIDRLREFIKEGVEMQKAVEAIDKATVDFGQAADTLANTIMPSLMRMFGGINTAGKDWVTLFGTNLPQSVETWTTSIQKAFEELIKLEQAANKINQINFQPWGQLSPLTSEGGMWNPTETQLQFQKSLGDAAGAIDAFVDRVIQAEAPHGGPNLAGASSAFGHGQFLKGTWLEVFRKHYSAEAERLGEAGMMALRNDLEWNRRLIRAFASDNAKALIQAGETVSEASLQLAHFLGPGGAIKVLKAAPGTRIADIPGMEAAVAANPKELGGGATREDVLAYAERRTQAARREKKAFDELYAANQRRLELAQRENTINANSTITTDQKTLAIEKEKIAQQLLTAAKEQGLTVDDALTAKINQQAEAMALAGLKAEQLARTQKDAAEAARQQAQVSEQLAQQYTQIAQGALSGFISDLRSGLSAGEAFRNMLDRVIDGMIDLALQAMFAQKGLGGVIGALLGGGGGQFGIASGGGIGLFHKGGIVGRTNVQKRRVSPALFANAPRLHNGLMPGEFPAILQRGEMVIPRKMVGKAGGAYIDNSSTTLGNISIDMSRSGAVAADNDRAREFGANIQKMIQAEIVRESRPGGLLRRVPQ